MNFVHFGDRLKKYRNQHRLSQSELGKLIDYEQFNVSYQERIPYPTLQYIIKFCSGLNIPLSEFFYTGEGRKAPVNEALLSFLRTVEQEVPENEVEDMISIWNHMVKRLYIGKKEKVQKKRKNKN